MIHTVLLVLALVAAILAALAPIGRLTATQFLGLWAALVTLSWLLVA